MSSKKRFYLSPAIGAEIRKIQNQFRTMGIDLSEDDAGKIFIDRRRGRHG